MTPRRGRCYLYIVQCRDGTYYTGSTNNLARRLARHHAGRGAKYVRGRGPVELVGVKAYRSYRDALRAEHRMKQRTRQEKEAFIRAHGVSGAGKRGVGGHVGTER